MNYLGDFEKYVLQSVSKKKNYTLKITNEIGGIIKKPISFGAVHTILKRLEKKKFVNKKLEASRPVQGGRRKNAYFITPKGKKALKTSIKYIQKVSQFYGGV